MHYDLTGEDLKELEGTYFPSKKRALVSVLASTIAVLALIYGIYAFGWESADKMEIALILVAAVAAFAIGVLTYGGRIYVGEDFFGVEFFFGIKNYNFSTRGIDRISVFTGDYRFTPLTIYFGNKIFNMPANQEFIDKVRSLQPVAGGDATR